MRQRIFEIAAFTLAELLIALGILGIIATFTIPKVLQSQADQKKYAVFKEAIAAISDVAYAGHLEGTICTSPKNYIDSHLNYIRRCSTNVFTEECWVGSSSTFTDPYGYVLANGATIVDVDATSCSVLSTDYEGIAIDWNGTADPNTDGDDQLFINVYYQNVYSASSKPGRITPYGLSAASVALWANIFTE